MEPCSNATLSGMHQGSCLMNTCSTVAVTAPWMFLHPTHTLLPLCPLPLFLPTPCPVPLPARSYSGCNPPCGRSIASAPCASPSHR
jgi:hypothetical protein